MCLFMIKLDKTWTLSITSPQWFSHTQRCGSGEKKTRNWLLILSRKELTECTSVLVIVHYFSLTYNRSGFVGSIANSKPFLAVFHKEFEVFWTTCQRRLTKHTNGLCKASTRRSGITPIVYFSASSYPSARSTSRSLPRS